LIPRLIPRLAIHAGMTEYPWQMEKFITLKSAQLTGGASGAAPIARGSRWLTTRIGQLGSKFQPHPDL